MAIVSESISRDKMATVGKPISKTMGGYAVTFDSRRIDISKQLYSSIAESLRECSGKNSKEAGHVYAYWLGILMGQIKIVYKRVKCVLCKKDIHKKDMMKEPKTYMTIPDVHKKCLDEYKKKESADQLLRDGDQEYKQTKEMKDQGVAKALETAQKIKGEIFNVA